MPDLFSSALLDSHPIPFDAIVEQSLAGIYVLQDECFVYANKTFAAMVGVEVEEMIGAHLSRFVPPDFLGEVLRLYNARLNADPPSIRFITHGMHRLGHEVRIEVHGTRILYRDRPAVMGVGIDVTQRLLSEAALERSNERLRALTRYSDAKLEDQRKSIARDVHDLVGGMLTSIKMEASRILRRVETSDLRDLTQRMIDLTQSSIEVVKNVSHVLRPSELDHSDLASAIDKEITDFGNRSGIRCVFERTDGFILNLSPRRATAVYRIFQEAITNVARHSAAKELTCSLTVQVSGLVLCVADDGRGFDAEQVLPTSMGLMNMKERASEIGAHLEVHSSAGSGTTVTLEVPLA